MNMNRATQSSVLIPLCFAVSAISRLPLAHAEGAAADVLDEVVVTATKRGESSVMDTPTTIQAIGARSLEQRGAVDFNDFANLIAGLTTIDYGPGDRRIILRGINSDGAGTVGVYLDEINITGDSTEGGVGLQLDPRLYDISRIEVLKGPQGTTFGSGGMTGVVRYITNKPDLSKWDADGRFAISQQADAHGMGSNADATLNAPLIADQLGVRVAVFRQWRPGYIDNRYEQGVNSEDTWSGRVEMRWKPSDHSTFDLMTMHQAMDTGFQDYNLTDVRHNPVPPLYQSNLERTGLHDRETFYNATYTHESEAGTFTVTGSDVRHETQLWNPASQVLAVVAHISNPDTPGIASTLYQPRIRRIKMGEARFASHWSSPLQLLIGVFGQSEHRDYTSTVLTVNQNGYVDPTSGVLYGPNLLDHILYTGIKEAAAFSELTWNATDRFSVVGGVRGFRFWNESQAGVVLGVLGTPGTGLDPLVKATEQSYTWKLNASYKIDPDLLTYATMATGYRPGGTNDTVGALLGGVQVPAGYNSDRLINYELGIKHTSADRSLDLTAATYFIDWSDMQLELSTPITPEHETRYSYRGNAGRTHAYGAELEAAWRPLSHLELNTSAAYTTAVLKQNVEGAGNAGETIPYTAKWKVTTGAEYSYPINANVRAFIGGDVNYLSARTTNFPSQPAPVFNVLDAYYLANVHVGADFGKWRASCIVRNLFDNATVTDVYYQSPPRTLNGYFRSPPRTISLEVSAHLN